VRGGVAATAGSSPPLNNETVDANAKRCARHAIADRDGRSWTANRIFRFAENSGLAGIERPAFKVFLKIFLLPKIATQSPRTPAFIPRSDSARRLFVVECLFAQCRISLRRSHFLQS